MKTKNILHNVGDKISPAFVFTIVLGLIFSITRASEIPDFAFPEQVVNRSDSLLQEALKNGEQEKALRCIMDIMVANTIMGSQDSGKENLSLIDSISSLLTGDFRRVAFLLKGEILSQIYTSRRGVFDSRNLPIDEIYPEDPMEWSGAMFRQALIQCVDSATINMNREGDVLLSGIQLLLTDTDEAANIDLTFPDFLSFKSVALLTPVISSMSDVEIPFFKNEKAETIEGKSKEKAVELLEAVIEHGTDPVKAIAVKEYAAFLPDYERKGYIERQVEKLKETEGAGYLYYTLWTDYSRGEPCYYKELNDWLEKYPEGFGNERVRYALSEMQTQRIQVSIPSVVLPDTPVKGVAEVSNIEKGYLLVVRLNKTQTDRYDGLIKNKLPLSAKPVRIIEMERDGETPFSYSQEITFDGLSPGLYAVIPSKEPKLTKGWDKSSYSSSYSTFRVTDIALLAGDDSGTKGSGKVYVVSGYDQSPIEGAKVSYSKGAGNKAIINAHTNSEGFVEIPEGYYTIRAAYGKSEARMESGFNYFPTASNTSRHVSVFPDLSVYRPGDTIRFVAIGWQQEKHSNNLLSQTRIKMELLDANYNSTGEIFLTTDNEGRANGFLQIPEGKLLGNYTLRASFPDFPRDNGGYASILVEEYKLPAFQVTLAQDKGETEKEICFKGFAATYAGLPVNDAKVEVEIRYVPWRWGTYAASAKYDFVITSDSEGEFEFKLPVENLKGTPFERGVYSAVATVTSLSGETEISPSISFYLGKGNDIRPDIKEKTEIQGDTISLYIPVYNMTGLPEPVPVRYTITNINEPSDTIKGEFISPTLELSSHLIKSGKYKIEFNSADASPVTVETVFWRDSEIKAPYPTCLWIPRNQYYYAENQSEIEITFGSGYGNYLLYILSGGEKELERKWINPSDTLLRWKVAIPQDSEDLFITLAGLHNLKGETGQIKISPKKSLEKMKIEATSFRENITAGNTEHWNFKFSIGERPATKVNAFAVMSDKALNSLRDFKWMFGLPQFSSYSKTRIYYPYIGEMSSFRDFTKRADYKRMKWPVPEWQTYGFPFGGIYFSSNGVVMYQARSMAMAKKESAMITDSMATAEENAVELTSTGNLESELPQFRPVELPLAFFMPDLQTDEEGNLAIDFTVPDFNTTWQLQVAGYNSELLNAMCVLDAVASKPVMVKTNLPQFLRTGDKAEISVSVYNNTDHSIAIEGIIEVFDAATNSVLGNKPISDVVIEPSQNKVFFLGFTVPYDLSCIGVKAYAKAEGNSDGEQGYIPVLPSSVPVVEATTFYAGTSEEYIKIPIPKLDKNSMVTLKYCDNPLWEALLSLPAITEDVNGSSLSLARWLYGTLISEKIIRENENISEGLRRILSSNDSSLSLSKLETDENLKIVSLEATPWINNARAETASIRALGKYLDKAKTRQKIADKVDALKHLQQKDGGFAWFEGMKSSPYITLSVIELMAYMNQAGVLDASLQVVGVRAVEYYDNYLKRMKEKNEKPDILSMLNYLYYRALLGISRDSQIKKIEAEVIDSVSTLWRHWQPGDKAKAGLLMLSSGQHDSDALMIASSLQEFPLRNIPLIQELFMLQFYEKTHVDEAVLEKVKASVFLKKETQEWIDKYFTPILVYTLLNDYPLNAVVRKVPVISIGDKVLQIAEDQALTGNFTLDINAEEAHGKKITINRESGIPAWGGLVSQSVKPVKDVKPAKVENLSIEKRIYKVAPDGTLNEPKTLTRGDALSVVLTISCGKDMDYVVVTDAMSAAFMPDERVSGMIFVDGMPVYKEVRADKTSYFIEHLPAGKHVISYGVHVSRSGEYALGLGEVQCLYSPAQVAHTAGKLIETL